MVLIYGVVSGIRMLRLPGVPLSYPELPTWGSLHGPQHC
jgi:hypothetical protein